MTFCASMLPRDPYAPPTWLWHCKIGKVTLKTEFVEAVNRKIEQLHIEDLARRQSDAQYIAEMSGRPIGPIFI